MKCIICGSPMGFFLSKHFGEYGLDTADYWRCNDCGFVISKTHAEMSPAAWEKVNYNWHASYQGKDSDPRDPKWQIRLQHQTRMLNDVQSIGLLDQRNRWLDYACGDAKLSAMLRAKYNLTLLNYEQYMPQMEGYIDARELVPGSFDFVITTALFEHFTRRSQFDFVDSLLSKEGVLGTHTLVCESVPADPAWFYLNPVHCAFHTNKSMDILFKQWGYTCSVYNVDAQLWLWFKGDAERVEAIVTRANNRNNGLSYIFKRGFVDYWKCAPFRQPLDKIEKHVE